MSKLLRPPLGETNFRIVATLLGSYKPPPTN